ncbi:single-stranded-DNA-specific exonuclease RecJ [Alteromonas facilis]|uniref:single-stranded-DNA-specific exonuclease RecJ n=1 Tax=Alteromonas facilis TaxID=2048004 RepID=UPI000C29024A
MSLNILRKHASSLDALPDWMNEVDVHPVLKRIFLDRGISAPEQLVTHAQALASYHQLLGVDTAIERLVTALKKQQRIVIVGDFDADGATSTALCLLALTDMGAKNLDHVVPNRFEYGYGLTPQIVDVTHQLGAQLIITVDNGISCHAGVQHAKSLGIDVIVTDHHLPAETLPPADAIVNPNQPGCGFPSKSLAGVGVAFYLMAALRARLNDIGWFNDLGIAPPKMAQYLDLVAVGTVADVVTLDHNNRVLVYQGLQRIRAGQCRPGILALLEVAQRTPDLLTSTDLGFVIGPRLNAAGRLDDMSLGIACLLTGDKQHARSIAMELDRLNQERKQIEHSMQQDVLASLPDIDTSSESLTNGVVLFQEGFHAGVIGIVAGRIKDKVGRPTIIFAQENETELKGSARSISGVHIRDALALVDSQHPGLISKFGGHAMAAGLSIKKADLDTFSQAFNQALAQWQEQIQQVKAVYSDGELPSDCFSLQFAQQLKYACPWGQGFPEPLFDGHFTLVQQRIVGEKHLKLLVATPEGELVDAIAFNVDTSEWPNNSKQSAHLAYKLDVNEFRGKRSLQLLVEALL